jgi:hypothetical protein
MHVRSFDVSHRGAASGIVAVETRLELESLVEFVRKSAGASTDPAPSMGGGMSVRRVVRPAAIEYDVMVTERLPSPVPIRDRMTTSVTPPDGGLFGRGGHRQK